MRACVIIPARFSSSRFPGKPLIKLNGKTMIEHVWSRTKQCKDLDQVFIATCDDEIKKEAIKSLKKYLKNKRKNTKAEISG